MLGTESTQLQSAVFSGFPCWVILSGEGAALAQAAGFALWVGRGAQGAAWAGSWGESRAAVVGLACTSSGVQRKSVSSYLCNSRVCLPTFTVSTLLLALASETLVSLPY